jgi:alpha-muurolene/germacrene-A/gamma-muurolene/(+)-delta-cadinol synthase
MEAISQQSRTGESGVVPSLSAYIEARRGNSGVWPFLDALEYSHRIDLPDHVIEHPIIVVLRQCTNDFVSWSNVRVSLPNHFVTCLTVYFAIGHVFIQR